MSNTALFETYLRELQKNLLTGAATEHTHRSALEALLEAAGDGVSVINFDIRQGVAIVFMIDSKRR